MKINFSNTHSTLDSFGVRSIVRSQSFSSHSPSPFLCVFRQYYCEYINSCYFCYFVKHSHTHAYTLHTNDDQILTVQVLRTFNKQLSRSRCKIGRRELCNFSFSTDVSEHGVANASSLARLVYLIALSATAKKRRKTNFNPLNAFEWKSSGEDDDDDGGSDAVAYSLTWQSR